jgi:hypothetical protein
MCRRRTVLSTRLEEDELLFPLIELLEEDVIPKLLELLLLLDVDLPAVLELEELLGIATLDVLFCNVLEDDSEDMDVVLNDDGELTDVVDALEADVVLKLDKDEMLVVLLLLEDELRELSELSEVLDTLVNDDLLELLLDMDEGEEDDVDWLVPLDRLDDALVVEATDE